MLGLLNRTPFPPNNLRIAPSDPLLPTSHLNDVIHVDPLHLQRNCDRRPPIRGRGRTRGGGYPNNLRQEPPLPSLISIVVGWATLLASAPPL